MMSVQISKSKAKDIWIQAQKLNVPSPFGKGPAAVTAAIQHLGYVQIDTISIIERCHHHILYNRIPNYKLADLHYAQANDKTVFEYWTHALSYLPTTDFKFFAAQMNSYKKFSSVWFSSVTKEDREKVKKLLKTGPVSIRDIKDDVLIEKNHPWGSAKPSKKALQLGFHSGEFVISQRDGMVKKYELTGRHFGWDTAPKAASESECVDYILDRSLRSQGFISLASTSHLEKMPFKQKMQKAIDSRVKANTLIEVKFEGVEKVKHWINPKTLEQKIKVSQLTHILSPFDPLIIQRKRLKMFFDYDHVFEAYIPADKRKYGYFGLPVMVGNDIVAVLDLKTDRKNQKLLIQKWTWLGKFKSSIKKKLIESELDRFEKFQLQTSNS